MLKRIGIDDLQVGMYVEKVDRPWLEIPFFKKRIRSVNQISTLREYKVKVLYINTEKGTQEPAPSGSARQNSSTDPSEAEPSRSSFPDSKDSSSSTRRDGSLFLGSRENIQVCRALQNQAVRCVREVFQSIENGVPPDLSAAASIVDEVINNLSRHPGILISLSKLKSYDEYTFMHCVNVAVFSMALGKSLHYTRNDLQKLGLGALFHDIGKRRIPNEILNKPGSLSPREMKQMRKHPLYSLELLRDVAGMNSASLHVPLEHHERISGKGYPRGLKGYGISEFGMIAMIADVYDAMTTERVYSRKMSPHTALSKIFAMGKDNFNMSFVERFIAQIGVYPVGTTVILDSGEVGVVTRIHRDHLLLPVVLILSDRNGRRVDPPDEVDLLYDTRKRRIQSVTQPERFGISIEELLKTG